MNEERSLFGAEEAKLKRRTGNFHEVLVGGGEGGYEVFNRNARAGGR